MDLRLLLPSLVPSSQSVYVPAFYFVYLAVAGEILLGKVIRGVVLSDGSQIRYLCNDLFALTLLIVMLGIFAKLGIISPFVTLVQYITEPSSSDKSASLKPHVSGNLVHDWWFRIQLNPRFLSIDLKFFFVRAGMMGWLLINLPILAKSVQDGSLSHSMIRYQIFCALFSRTQQHLKRSLPQLLAEPTEARSYTVVGTHEYLAPEIIRGEGHGAAVDWWTFGVLLYELLYGKTPFKGYNNNQTLANVAIQNLKFPDNPVVSFQAKDLIRGLLVKEPENRLGSEKGSVEIKRHPFFEGLNWALIRCATPPELPDCYDDRYLECKAIRVFKS